MKYAIHMHESPTELQKLVTQSLSRGLIPTGGCSVETVNGVQHFMQAMYETHREKTVTPMKITATSAARKLTSKH